MNKLTKVMAMQRKEQAQLALEICEKMSQLERALWDKYHQQFMDIIMDKNDLNSRNDDGKLDEVF